MTGALHGTITVFFSVNFVGSGTGALVGCGPEVGVTIGTRKNDCVGDGTGVGVGTNITLGDGDGEADGETVGVADGETVGDADGEAVGETVGDGDGDGVDSGAGRSGRTATVSYAPLST